MSQYPSPYSTPNPLGYPYDPAAAILAPAKRAAILMFVLGGFGLLCGVCSGTFAAVGPIDQFIKQSGVQLPSAEELQMSPEQLVKIIFATLAVLSLVQAILTIVLAIFVRRGAMAAIIISLVLCVLIELLFLLRAAVSIFQLARGQISGGLVEIAITFGLIAAYGLLFVSLIQASRAASAAKAMRLQYQSQYWQYQQQQTPGGYAPPPPPPPNTPEQKT